MAPAERRVTRCVLAGDVGGTKTLLALYDVGDDGRLAARREASFRSVDYRGLEPIVAAFLAAGPEAVAAAAFGIAGPVVDGVVEVTNLGWHVAADALARAIGCARARLMNDLESTAYGALFAAGDQLLVLQAGEPRAGNRAVIAAGTGLGEAGLFWDGAAHRPFATEGGHADFAPGDELEVALLGYLQREHGRVSWERVVSGPGLVQLYRFLRQRGEIDLEGEPPGIAAEMQQGDPGEVISRYAAAGRSALCARAMELFVKLYAAEAGNLALKLMATGGLYIGGGIAVKNLEWMKSPDFIEAFLAKGRMRPLLEAMPVRVLLNADTALLGAARRAAADLR